MFKIEGEGVSATEVNDGVELAGRYTEPDQAQVLNEKHEESDIQSDYNNYLKFECLTVDDDERDVTEPFASLANKMFNVLSNGKIKKQVIKQGHGLTPHSTSTVKIHYNAYVQFEAQPFDSTYARKKPFEFVIGDSGCIEGLEICVKSMQIAEKSQFLIDHELAYKNSGLKRIPPKSTVLFEIELISTMNTQIEPELTEEDQFEYVFKLSNAYCAQAKQKFNVKDYSGAALDYETGIRKMENCVLRDYDDQMKSQEFLVRNYTNALVCYTHLNRPKRGCYYANQIYMLAKNGNVTVDAKVYFNNAKCLTVLGDFKLARIRLREALKRSGNKDSIQKEFEEVRKAEIAYAKREQVFAKGFLSSN